MDMLITILFFFTSICRVRHSSGLSTDISNSVKNFDLKYEALLNKTADRDAIQTLDKSASFFGRLGGLYFGIYFISLLLKLNDSLWLECVYFAFIISFGLFFSIKWFTQPKQFALQFFLDYTKIFSAFFLFAMIDWLAGTNLTWVFYELFNINKILGAVQLPVPLAPHPILMALILFSFIEVILILFCVVSTIIFASVTFFSFVVVVILIRMSRFINKKFDEDPLQGTCTVLFFCTLLYQTLQACR